MNSQKLNAIPFLFDISKYNFNNKFIALSSLPLKSSKDLVSRTQILNFTDCELSLHFQPEYWLSNNFSKLSCNKRVDLDEYQVVREILWLLSGSSNSFLFNCIPDTGNIFNLFYSPTYTACLSHLSITCLDNCLLEHSKFASFCLCLRSIVRYIVSLSCDTLVDGFLAGILGFSHSLNKFIYFFERFIEKLELRARSASSLTLFQLQVFLRQWFRRFFLIAYVLNQATGSCLESIKDKYFLPKLLDLLYDMCVNYADCCIDTQFVDFIRVLFFFSFRPYFVYLFNIVLSNNCSVERSILKLNFAFDPKHPDFWFLGFTSDEMLSNLSLLVPNFIRSTMKDLILCLKSLYMLKAFSLEYDCSQSISLTGNTDLDFFCLEKTFFPENFLNSFLDFEHIDFNDQNFHKNVMYKGEHSKLCLLKFVSSLKVIIHNHTQTISCKLMSCLMGTLPVLVDLNYRSIRKCLSVVASVYLFDAGDRMYTFYRQMFNMFRYSVPWLHDISDLNLRLRTALDNSYLYISSDTCNQDILISEKENLYFLRNVDKPKHSTEFDLSGFSLVQLIYRVHWPVNIVLTESNLCHYNGVFKFTMQIKRAKWALDHLAFSDLILLDFNKFFVHRIYLLRIKMLFIVNNLHDFIMYRIQAIKCDFFKKWNIPDNLHKQGSHNSTVFLNNLSMDSSFQSIGDLINSHLEFVHKLCCLCLIDDKSPEILRHEIESLLMLSLRFESLWLGRLTSKVYNSLEFNSHLREIEILFEGHVKFLASMLSNAVKVGRMSQLEPLEAAFIISSSNTNFDCN